MKTLEKGLSTFCMLLMLVVFTACEDDDVTRTDRLIEYTWRGDFGGTAVIDGMEYPLFSDLTFSPRHIGIEHQYFDNGEGFQTLDFDWDWDGPDLCLRYYDPMGDYLLYLCSVDIYRGVLTGRLVDEYGKFLMNVRLLAL